MPKWAVYENSESEGHMESARLISDALYAGERPGGERCLEERGWVKLARQGGWTSECDDGVFFVEPPTGKQICKLLDLGRLTPKVQRSIELAHACKPGGPGRGAEPKRTW